MQTSKYILLSYIGFIALLTLILYIDSAKVFTDRRAETTPPQTSEVEVFSTGTVSSQGRIQGNQDSVISVTYASKKGFH